MKQYALWVLFLLAVLGSHGCAEPPQRAALTGGTMGTTWSVVYGDPQRVDPRQLQASIEAELTAINQALSTYIPKSEVSRLNYATQDAAQTVSSHVAAVLTAALNVGEVTQGAYDISVGPLIDLWGFGVREFDARVPDQDEIDRALLRVGVEQLQWDDSKRRLFKPAGMNLDFSSIAKGYAVDRVSNLLRDAGLENTLVEIGGELRATGTRPEGGAWRLAVESPEPVGQRFMEALSLGDTAVATSGDYRNFFEVDGQRYSHLIDPRTGFPVAHDLVSVTVVAETCMEADAFATALLVLGLDDALALAEERGLAAYFVSRSNDGLAVNYTSAFDVYRYRGEGADA